jgi:hypothetical protein
VSSYNATNDKCLNVVITRGRIGNESCRPIYEVGSLRTYVHVISVVIENRVQAKGRGQIELVGGDMKREADLVSDIVFVSAIRSP